MSNYKELSLAECADRLLSVERPLVVMHIRPDGDTVGSGAALCEIFRALGKEPRYTCPDPIPERLAFLVEGFTRSDEYEKYDAVAIDVPSPMQLGELSERLRVSFMIDHHRISTPFAPHYTVSTASSAGEVLLGLARELQARGELCITKKMAELIYAAISSDTGGFAYSNATEKTYRDAADLISLGIDHADINRRLFDSKSEKEILAEGIIGARLETGANGKIAYATLTKEERESLGLSFSDFETSIDIVRALRGSEIAFVIKETDSGEYKASLRSVGANVAEVAARHSGGGHIRAAGCTVSAGSMKEARDILIKELELLV